MATALFFKNPMLGLETVKAVTGHGEDACLALIESGRIRYAFDLATPNRHRRLVRVFALSLVDFVQNTDTQPPTLDGVVRFILPGSSPELHASWLARKLNVSHTHVHHLLHARCITEVKDPERRKTNDRIANRASAMKFLTSRRCI